MHTDSTILIVDDEEFGRDLLGDLLAPHGYHLLFAANGYEAVQKATTCMPDLILLDVMMPGMDGFAVCRQLRALPGTAVMPIVMVTALDDRESRIEGIEAGADDFLSKPIDRLELQVRVRMITRTNRYRLLMEERQRAEEKARQAAAEIAAAYDMTLVGWSQILDLRDHETEGHSQRVTDVTVLLARALGITSPERLAHIRRGSLLHDIGKLAVPDAILQKPGRLTEAEWVIMRQHPVYAYEWLKSVPFLVPALDIPYAHHEKWDGSGYPRGLRGTEIPLAARIFAVVDVWDALRSNRPYRAAWPDDQVYAYIRDQIGSHFEPVIAEAFLEMTMDLDNNSLVTSLVSTQTIS